jgi:hypothetical protein|tara:strand:- start:116 stop:448 length:333 start_codon:yes stop_codon:yes gene_type:complete
MPFEKNHTKKGGRKAGQPNKTSKEIREASALLLGGQLETLGELLPTLKPNDYLKAIAMLYKVVVPQQRQVETETITHPTNFEITIIDKLKDVSNKDVDEAINDWEKDFKL